MESSKKISPQVQITNNTSVSIEQEEILKVVQYTCRKHQKQNAQISIAIVDDDTITALHKQYFGDEKTTDVISFDLSEPDEPESVFDIIVNADMAKRISTLRNTDFCAELVLYILHGLLHNLGFDDLNKQDFERMHTEENTILETLGYGSVFGDAEFEG